MAVLNLIRFVFSIRDCFKNLGHCPSVVDSPTHKIEIEFLLLSLFEISYFLTVLRKMDTD